MQTINELNTDILNITMTIQHSFPELSKYLSEMPVTIPNESNPKINIKSLQAYYNSLNDLLETYSRNPR